MLALPPALKNRFIQKEKFSSGIDIGTAEIKAVKLKWGKDAPELYAVAAYPAQPDLAGALKNVVRDLDIKKANISVSGPAVIIRQATLPRMTEEELGQAIKFEAEKHIPFPIAEVNTDARILKADLAENKMLVMIAAVKKDFLNQRLKLLGEAGLKVNLVDIDSLAIINAFFFNNPEADKTKAIALLNIGAAFSNLNILEGSIPRLSRDIHIAGNNINQKIADTLGIDSRAAEALKVAPDRVDKANPAVDAVLLQLSGEIRTSFDYFESQSASSINKIFLSGGGSLCPKAKESIANSLGVEVEYWDPLKQINVAPRIDQSLLKNLMPKLAVAIGLALRQ